MAQTLDPKAAIKYAPKDLQPFLKSTTKGTKFSLFLAADNWNKKPSSQWVISVSSADVASICLLYTSPSPRDGLLYRMPSSA